MDTHDERPRNDEEIHLGADPVAVRQARHHVDAVLAGAGWAAVERERARLAVSELVTNAVVHAHSQVILRCRLGADLLIEVTDGAPGIELRPRPAVPEGRTGGMGLYLIDRLSQAWGVDHGTAAKTVWCRVAGGTGPSRAPGPRPAASGLSSR